MSANEKKEILLEMIASGEVDLPYAHEMVWGGLKANVTLAECAAHLPDVIGDYAKDAVALTGLSPSAKLRQANRAQVELVAELLTSGVLYPPWPSYPWWPEPDEPF